MGSSQSELRQLEVDDLERTTGFSQDQIRNLHKRFKTLTNEDDDVLRKIDLENISDLTLNPIRNQIITAFFNKRNYDENEKGFFEEINFEKFVTVMSYFKPLNQNLPQEERQNIRKKKLRFLFNMHDKDGDNLITLDEYKRVVEELLSNAAANIDPETIKEVADAAMMEVSNVTQDETAPDGNYAGITFDHFLQILKGVEIESKMHIRFLNVDTGPMNCSK